MTTTSAQRLIFSLLLSFALLLFSQTLTAQCEGVKNSGQASMLNLLLDGSNESFDIGGINITIKFNKVTGKTEISGTNGMKFHTDGNGNIVKLNSSVNVSGLSDFETGPVIMYDLANNNGAFGGGVAGFIGLMVGDRYGWVEMLKCGATTCGEYVFNVENGGLSAAVNGSATTSACASLSISTPVINDPSIYDPCSCTDPLNVPNASGEVVRFHDYVEISDNAGETWTYTALNSGNVLMQDGTAIPLNTTLTYNAITGRYRMDLYHNNGVGYNATFTRTSGGTLTTGGSCSDCLMASAPIPTMSQWGLFIFGLLIMNLSLFIVLRLKRIHKIS